MPSRKNLLFLMTDHQRADSIGMVQCGREVTPNLNRLAKESAHFTRAYTTCPLCVPARTALATGLYPTASGMVWNDFKWTSVTPHATLHSNLRDAGYTVGHVGVNHIRVLPPLREEGFSCFYEEKDYSALLREYGITFPHAPGSSSMIPELLDGKAVETSYSNTQTGVWAYDPALFKDRVFASKGEEFLASVGESSPFALFVCLWAPHPPLTVPAEFAGMYDPSLIDLPANVGQPAKGEPPFRRKSVPAQLAEGVRMAEWRKVWAAHLALTSYADGLFGGLLEKLKSLGVYDDTVIVFTSDHGESLGQHSMYQKMEMYEQCVNIPLLIKAAALPTGNMAMLPVAKRTEVVSHLDVLPTLCDLLSLPKPAGADGHSLLQTAEGRTVFSQYTRCIGPGSRRRAAVNGRWKYVIDEDGEEELYDLQFDPLEMNNLAGSPAYAVILSELAGQCRSYHQQHGDVFFIVD